MLAYEREVVGALGNIDDRSTRTEVEAFVSGSLRAMPEHIRAGVMAESLLLGGYTWLLRCTGRLPRRDPTALRARLDAWEHSPIGPVRQYVRMFRAVVLFGENELRRS